MATAREGSGDDNNTKYLKLRDQLAKKVSVSGLGYTIGTAVTFPRRSIWCLIVLSALAWMVILIYGRVTYFLSFPTATNILIKTEQKLRFPAVTVCNQNMFSATKVFNADTQRESPTFVEALNFYMKSIALGKVENATETPSSKTREKLKRQYGDLLKKYNVSTLFEQLAMEKERFIHKCAWMGQEEFCSSDDFEKSITDLGLCYTFNGNVTSSRHTSKTGSAGGLSLTLFIEHYDYFLHGASKVAGAMVHIHDQKEEPSLITHSGVSVPVGFSSSIGLRTLKMTYLTPPYGICAEALLSELPTNTPYSTENCRLNCLTGYVKSKCGCVDSYMPRTNGTRYCTLFEKTGCLMHEIENFSNLDILSSCDCPLPCSSTSYVHYVSYASIADHFSRNLAILHRNTNTSSYKDKLNIQEWILLNALNTTYTDTIANISFSIIHLYERVQRLSETAANISLHINVSENVSATSTSKLIADVETQIRLGKDFTIKNVQNYFKQAFECLKDMLCTNVSKNSDAFIASVITEEKTWALKFNNVQLVDIVWSTLENEVDRIKQLILKIGNEMDNPTVSNKELLTSVKQRFEDYNSDMLNIISDLRNTRNVITDLTKAIEPYSLWLYKEKEGDTEKYTPLYYQRNYLNVDIYFEDMTMQHVSQEESYSLIALFSDIGGSIGLCLGGSILTIVEIADVIMTWWAGRKSEQEETESKKKYELSNGTRDDCKESIHM